MDLTGQHFSINLFLGKHIEEIINTGTDKTFCSGFIRLCKCVVIYIISHTNTLATNRYVHFIPFFSDIAPLNSDFSFST